MKFLLSIVACIMMVGCAGTMANHKKYEKAANDFMMEFVPQMINSIPMAFPGADHLQAKEITLTQDGSLGFIVLTAEDQKGKVYETLYLLIACAPIEEKVICVPASILTGYSVKGLINKYKILTQQQVGE